MSSISASSSSSLPALRGEALLRDFVGGERGQKLRTQLASWHPERSTEEVEDAVQTACERFVSSATEISSPGEVYAWIRTTAHRVLNRRDERSSREIAVDPVEGVLEQLPASDPDPAEAVLARESDNEMETLVRAVTDSLPARRRKIIALRLAGYKRAEIGDRLGLSARAVERDLLKIMDEARTVLARRAGGGCAEGEPLVLRLIYGLASATEAAQARMHLDRCHRCSGFYERLAEWREKAAAMFPAAPAIEGTSPGTLERVGQRVADAVGSAKEQVLGASAQAKQHAAATYYRAVDPTPLAGVRPSAVAAVVASCITIGGGAAAYCADQSVDPIGAATGLIGGSEQQEPEPPPPSDTPSESQEPVQPSYEAAPPSYEVEPTPAPTEQAATEAAPPEASSPEKKAEPSTEAAPPEPQPAPEQEFEPSSPEYPVTEAAEEAAPSSPSVESAPVEAAPEPTESASPKPAPVPANSPGEFEP